MTTKRSVLLTIDDPEVAHLLIDMTDEHDIVMDTASVPVPPDDQLTQDLDAVTRYFLGRVPTEPNDAAMRIRAALGLDEESE